MGINPCINHFNSRSLRGKRYSQSHRRFDSHQFQFTLLTWGAMMSNVLLTMTSIFSIHAPRMGSDPSNFVLHDLFLFQFTLPAGGATVSVQSASTKTLFQFTLPAWRATRARISAITRYLIFNSRSLYGERHLSESGYYRWLSFQFTLHAWRATKSICISKAPFYFSIHAPRMGSDGIFQLVLHRFEFSIHAPRMGSDGGRIFL